MEIIIDFINLNVFIILFNTDVELENFLFFRYDIDAAIWPKCSTCVSYFSRIQNAAIPTLTKSHTSLQNILLFKAFNSNVLNFKFIIFYL